jgi:tetratricopeptide (TPR) repeat protein
MMNRFKELANHSFIQRDFKKALLNYSLALKEAPEDKEAKIGALLADLAFDKEDEAIALFEYYEVSKAAGTENAEEAIERLIENFNIESELAFDLLSGLEEQMANLDDGILFDEFIAHVTSREDVKRALEDLMFSSKIIIYKKEDFVELIGMLLESGYKEMAYNYIENALLLYPDDTIFYELLNELEK